MILCFAFSVVEIEKRSRKKKTKRQEKTFPVSKTMLHDVTSSAISSGKNEKKECCMFAYCLHNDDGKMESIQIYVHILDAYYASSR
jgi:hypothetical protein